MFALIMDIKALIFLFEIIFVYCQSGQDDHLGMPSSIISRGIGYTDFSNDEAKDIVERHNFHRSNTKPPASNMKHMTWDNDLATMSQKWADTCVYEHGGTEGTYNTSPYSSVGQNLARGTYPSSKSGVEITNLWHAEEEDFTYDTNTCKPLPKQCGHYTQVVWAKTQTVGCGRKLCPTIYRKGIPIMTNGYYIVCDYGDGGNVEGEKPFKTGERCSECPNDAGFCSDNSLCRDCTKTSDLASCGECNRRCENCGTLDSITCTCQCAPGWDGPTCSDVCADHDELCGANPGWPSFWCYETDKDYVRQSCLKMCGICKSEDPNFVCGEPPMKRPKYCKTTYTAASVIDSNLFVFKKDKYWQFDDIKNGNLETSAGGDLVRNIFPKVNPNVRAVYQRPDNKVVIFRGAKYWLYTYRGNGWTRDAGFPKDISETFPGLSPPTAAVYDTIEAKTYFFSGTKFWRFDERLQQFDIAKEPVTTMFDGIPNKISGAFIDENSDFILVKGRDFWRVRRGERKVASTKPKNLALEFLDCYA
ncbi:uncharacterized protein [Amphiura filiformis]|uniref:uncharacterized protein n=1 Tax=Amphiura filiformis TaxID=82378 RepID=UPI003B21317C